MAKGIQPDDALRMVGPGWGNILKRLYAKLPDDILVTQVKEKWGYLHFYVGNATLEASRLIDDAEEESMTTCEVCGEPGEISTVGWWVCRCPKHKAV